MARLRRNVAIRSLLLSAAVGAVAASDSFSCPSHKHVGDAAAVPISGSGDKTAHAHGLFLPVFAHPASGSGRAAATVKKALIFVANGVNSTESSFVALRKLTTDLEVDEDTLIVVPAFPEEACSQKGWIAGVRQTQAVASTSSLTSAVWSHRDAWSVGGASDGHQSGEGVSSFTVMDRLVRWVQEEYPSLHRIAAIGDRQGANFLLRWSIVSAQGSGRVALPNNLPFRVLLLRPSEMLYLTAERPGEKCRETSSQGHGDMCSQWEKPDFCASKDKFAFGLSGLSDSGNHTSGSSIQLVRKFVAKSLHEKSAESAKVMEDGPVLAETLIERLATKDVRFFLATDDAKSCGTVSCPGRALPLPCPLSLQGGSPLQRGLNYLAHLARTLPDYTPTFSLLMSGHSLESMLNFDEFQASALLRTLDTRPNYKELELPVANEGKAIEYHTASHHEVWECAGLCNEMLECKSFSYNPHDGYCILRDRCVTSTSKLANESSRSKHMQTIYRECSQDEMTVQSELDAQKELMKSLGHIKNKHLVKRNKDNIDDDKDGDEDDDKKKNTTKGGGKSHKTGKALGDKKHQHQHHAASNATNATNVTNATKTTKTAGGDEESGGSSMTSSTTTSTTTSVTSTATITTSTSTFSSTTTTTSTTTFTNTTTTTSSTTSTTTSTTTGSSTTTTTSTTTSSSTSTFTITSSTTSTSSTTTTSTSTSTTTTTTTFVDWRVLGGVAVAQGLTLAMYDDTSLFHCRERCSNLAGCMSFSFSGTENKTGKCNLQDKCISSHDTALASGKDDGLVTHYRPCEETHGCDHLEDHWITDWGNDPTQRCQDFLFNAKWGQGGMYTDCSADWVRAECAKSCCSYWGPGSEDEPRAAGYMVTPRVIVDEGKVVADLIDRYYTIAECTGACNRHRNCRSFSYDGKFGHCHLKERCVSSWDSMVAEDDPRAYVHTHYRRCSADGGSRLFDSRREAWSSPSQSDDASGPQTRPLAFYRMSLWDVLTVGTGMFLAVGSCVAIVAGVRRRRRNSTFLDGSFEDRSDRTVLLRDLAKESTNMTDMSADEEARLLYNMNV
mmetsp:Transcript_190/g.435  ORF Transcript_190/g.435 Transcript_190/m.435 type:complete len:1066 (+) Transcript_190:182-3379(+)|eukprot:CAMPEP_0206424846 /NCGR_PEP_ID=MMETSP0324_2-20121206/3459_1 /ASSEMBLY_ACC=CAM_ASM_000836 /TAXON_ID=2866 /ORGANISM="Crypthecodinium cohnii, Strain Seligo" /LENGTH=1065 /DNA_ID=CAMNT_0053889555 /DNA_START=99 /DNA_END=3296 /DNA_ORIENTATION=-